MKSEAIALDVAELLARLPEADMRRPAPAPDAPVTAGRMSERLTRAFKRARRHDVGGRVVYAIGDIHGRCDLLLALLAAIVEDVREHPAAPIPVLVLLGDYVDRGERSADVLTVIDAIGADPRIELYALKGNHEAVMIDYLADPESALGWLRVGGDATMRSYGVSPPAPDAPIDAHRDARDHLCEAMPASHVRLLDRLRLTVAIGGHLFVHAGVRPGVPLGRQSEDDLLWIRDGFLDRRHGFDATIVHGHSWSSAEPVVRRHRIGVDTGAYRTGVLTAVRIDDDGHRFLHARGATET